MTTYSRRAEITQAIVAAFVGIVLAVVFYTMWERSIQQRVDRSMDANPVIQTVVTLQTRIATP